MRLPAHLFTPCNPCKFNVRSIAFSVNSTTGIAYVPPNAARCVSSGFHLGLPLTYLCNRCIFYYPYPYARLYTLGSLRFPPPPLILQPHFFYSFPLRSRWRFNSPRVSMSSPPRSFNFIVLSRDSPTGCPNAFACQLCSDC